MKFLKRILSWFKSEPAPVTITVVIPEPPKDTSLSDSWLRPRAPMSDSEILKIVLDDLYSTEEKLELRAKCEKSEKRILRRLRDTRPFTREERMYPKKKWQFWKRV